MRFLTRLTILLMTLGTACTAVAEELITLQTRDGIEQRYLLSKPATPDAAVILFAGGMGALNLSGGLFGVSIGWGNSNFLVRTRDKFAAHNLMVAVVDAPSDHQGKDGMLGGFRDSAEHVKDIDAVIADLRQRADVPVWLVGTSRGTESAANVALHSSQRPHGVVLTSAMSVSNNKGTAVTEMDLDKLRIPTLITAHENDGCNKTPPEGGQEIYNALTNASKRELKTFSGGYEEGNPCKAKSYHGYLGIESEVVDYIANFIKNN